MARASRHQRLQEEVNVTSESSDFNESFSLPRVEVLSEDDELVDTEEFIPEEFYKEWMSCQNKYTIKIMALILMDTFRTCFRLTDVRAAEEAGLVVGYSERSIREWHKEFYENEGEFGESLKGKHCRPYVLDDENCRKKALTWLHERAYDKDQPCMTAYTFANWVNSDLLPNTHLPSGFPLLLHALPENGCIVLGSLLNPVKKAYILIDMYNISKKSVRHFFKILQFKQVMYQLTPGPYDDFYI